MKYYELVRGDYIHHGDEYYSSNNEEWTVTPDRYIGLKYGYDIDNQTKLRDWPPVRRLVPDGFISPRDRGMSYIEEQWGSEFEI